jgi:uncharacterized membrane protein YkvA (DUF1232 family)
MRLLMLFKIARKVDWRHLPQVARQLPAYLQLGWRLLTDARTPAGAKFLLVVTLAYLVSPFDFLPDYIPFLGESDDLALLWMAFSRFLTMIPAPVRREHEVACGLSQPSYAYAGRRS